MIRHSTRLWENVTDFATMARYSTGKAWGFPRPQRYRFTGLLFAVRGAAGRTVSTSRVGNWTRTAHGSTAWGPKRICRVRPEPVTGSSHIQSHVFASFTPFLRLYLRRNMLILLMGMVLSRLCEPSISGKKASNRSQTRDVSC